MFRYDKCICTLLRALVEIFRGLHACIHEPDKISTDSEVHVHVCLPLYIATLYELNIVIAQYTRSTPFDKFHCSLVKPRAGNRNP